MGCWNQTCGLSNLAIRYGDPVTVFLIEPSTEQIGGGGFCYSDDVFVPAFVPIHGKYNDYGAVEEIEPGSEILYERFVAAIGGKAARTTIETDKYEDAKMENMEDLIKLIERGRVFQKSFSGEEGHWGFIMFHTHIYRAMIERVAGRIPYNQTRTFGELTLAKQKELVAKRKKEQEDDIFWMSDEFRSVTGSMSSMNTQLLETVVETHSVEECAELFTDAVMFKEAMALLRKAWIPQCGQGSQNAEYALHVALGDSVKEHVLHVRKEFEDMNGEELEPDFGEETLFWH